MRDPRRSSYLIPESARPVLKVLEPKRGAPSRAGSALDVLNPCFSLHVVMELEAGPRHFNDLSRSIPASGNTLSSRLRLLEREGIITREVISYMPPSVRYELTDKGQELAEIVRRIGEWDAQWAKKTSGNEPQTAADEPSCREKKV